MGQGITGNIQVCPGPYLTEPGTGLHLADEGDTEWQDSSGKKYASERSRRINNGDVGNLNIYIGSKDSGFGEDGNRWAWTAMEMLD